MMHWLEPSLIATLIVTFVMFSSFCYLYHHEHERSLKFFAIAWALYSLRFIFRLFNLHYSISLAAEVANYYSNFLNCGFLMMGVTLMLKKSVKNQVPVLLMVSTAAIILLFSLHLSNIVRTTIVFMIAGSFYIFIGYSLIKLKSSKKIYIILGIDFILWGLHKYDYPIFYDSAVFAPFGYILAVLFSIIAAQGFQLLYYQTAKDELVSAKLKAEESSQIKSAFLSNINHELRTPLNGTLGMLSLVMDNNNPENTDEYIRMAYKSSEDMLYLVEDILSFSQYNGRQLKPEITEFELIDDIRTLVELNNAEAARKGLRLEMAAEQERIKIHSDKMKLNQIIVNLLNNAIKFSDEGIINISVSESSEEVFISIHDQGVGIPGDKIDLIFEPFYQLEDPYTKTRKGIGAGLAIVKSLCELLDIKITVESDIKVGTDITLEFSI